MWDLAKDKHKGLAHQRIRELFDYNQRTGQLIRKVNCRGASKGVVGCKNPSDGYLGVRIDKEYYQVHRVIWFWMTGNWPKCQLDHKNGARADNRWNNLREATNGQNSLNQGLRKDNTSGAKGITFDKNRNKYRVRISISGVSYMIGRYDTLEEAKEWRKLAEEEFYGEFAK
jgi:hypothetical protein